MYYKPASYVAWTAMVLTIVTFISGGDGVSSLTSRTALFALLIVGLSVITIVLSIISSRQRPQNLLDALVVTTAAITLALGLLIAVPMAALVLFAILVSP